MTTKTPLSDDLRFTALDGAIGQCTDVIGAVALLRGICSEREYLTLERPELTGLKYLLEQVNAELTGISEVLAGEFERLQAPLAACH